MPVTEIRTPALADSGDEAALRRRALLVSGVGFFTDAYDLFVIGIVSTLLKGEWHLGTGELALLNAVMLGAAFLGATFFGRLADAIGRTRVYWMSAALMVLAAIGSALSHLPRVARTRRTGTPSSIWRSTVVTRSPPWLTSATTRSARKSR